MTRCLLTVLVTLAVAGWSPVTAQERAAPPPLRILVANDDGYQAPGLIALVDSLVPIAHVVVAAPLEQQSGTGHGITYRDPIRVSEVGNPYSITWYAIDARPATCIRLALTALLDTLPDLVVSGVNTGENVGLSTWLSGTVAAAREAAFHGLPAIAASVGVGGGVDYEVAAGYVRGLVERLRDAGALEQPMLLNVNVPAGGAERIKGIRIVSMGLVQGRQGYERRLSPRGLLYFWDNWSPPEEAPEGTDVAAFEAGYVTITPLRIDQTDTKQLAALHQELLGWGERPERR